MNSTSRMKNNLDLVRILSQASELNELQDFDSIPLPRHASLQPQVPQQQQVQSAAAMMAMPMPVPSFSIKPLPDDNVKAAHKSSTAASNKPSKKRSRKKPAGKPKRPLSAYNLFFQAERKTIIAEKIRAANADTDADAGAEDLIPPCTGIPYKLTTKRAHRRSHGKIGFAALAQNVAAKWKVLDEASKKPFEAEAAVEKIRYKRELEVWERNQALKRLAEWEEEEGDSNDETKKPTERKEKTQQERRRKRARSDMKLVTATPPSAPSPSSQRYCLDKMEVIFKQLEPIDIKSMNSMIAALPTKATAMSAAPVMSQHSMLSASNVMPPPAVNAPLPDVAQPDAFDASLDAIFGDNLNNIPDVMTSLERIDTVLDGEFNDFFTAF